jgi:TetR/AcrR family transcriptional regulator, transcriptional repressor for nem operon
MKDVRQPRAIETRGTILEAAAHLFALQRYHETTIDEVLAAARVTKGAFFYHFRGCEDLGFAVLDWHMQKRRRQLEAIERELPPVPESDPLGRVFRRLDAIRELIRRRERRAGAA